MLYTFTPELYMEYFREVASQLAGLLNPAPVAVIMSHYDTQVLPPSHG